MSNNSTVNRRDFIRYSGLSGVALVLGFSSAHGASKIENLSALVGQSFNLSPYVIIEKSGKITLINNKPEMGQGTQQSITALIAEELELGPDQYVIKQSGGQKKHGNAQFAGGSFSVRNSYDEMRKVGASAKEMLLSAAAKAWNCSITDCYADRAKVYHRPSGKSLPYSDLVETASTLEVPKSPSLKNPKDFKIIGKEVKRQDIPTKVNGTAVFGIDAVLPNMVYASVERSPVFGAALVKVDKSATEKITGVLQVVEIERDLGAYKYPGIAVVATNYWSALKGRKALNVTWDYRGNNKFNSKDYNQSLRDLAKTEGVVQHSNGDFDKVFAESKDQVESLYETPIISHSPMEAMNCTAHWKENNTLEIWASTQVPSWVIGDLTNRFGLKEDDINLNVCFNGGGFGRRLATDFIVEAVNLSKAIKKPVKLVWTREDDTQLGPFRPPTFSAMKGTVMDGKIDTFQHKVISPTIVPLQDKSKVDTTMVEGISEQKYEIPNMKNMYVYSDVHIPFGYWRSVTSSTLAFAHECFIDELAAKAGKDPMEFRLGMLNKPTDTKRVMEKLKEVSNWSKPLPKGKGRGVAQYEFFAGLAGQVVEVSSINNAIKIDKVYVVVDLGVVVNPDTVKAQMEGAVAMGITAAIKNGITFAGGKAEQSNFHDNPVIRINEMPAVEIHILTQEGGRMKGVGEPGLPPLAPALANAIFAATGKRLRKLPLEIDFV
ncbi:xanthine dehydrogenase family protein molybdopterin-binding subunit [Sandaracinomonas limnophila]|uniref:Xanthine dehydrogenase family protein molybdopterin-binding subunit n=1 Tax=Sandaracinomonas limnophila TaxID=1862386 RepID=A0A437PXL6_9BACT|nr:molybdopterin cofactor-binding domain-containing protein [Sandaracinomonas limnophila]RVU26992.1 xanthine dehydrogenase family protein molybdopterin-binding subunit [Sandaracinomonas limnophila]